MKDHKLPLADSEAMPQWLDERTVAAITGISIHTLRSHRQKRVGIAYAKIGRSVRYSMMDVQSFMKSHRIAF
ncbi:helix-turn-helix domain-containing protein [uncultured Bilophila sp.]|uniref:helix-turn-helix domain-containing protein n=1 Tax=uncultured Bilophila sp. TaxID=529385 RepID=UPI00266F1F9E|nr:helix-turn-helix domain-containing protein [uncultured Bilophila sp.]